MNGLQSLMDLCGLPEAHKPRTPALTAGAARSAVQIGASASEWDAALPLLELCSSLGQKTVPGIAELWAPLEPLTGKWSNYTCGQSSEGVCGGNGEFCPAEDGAGEERAEGYVAPITENGLGKAMELAALGMGPWRANDFAFDGRLQEAERNHGHVERMRRTKGGALVAVKQMPNWWVTHGAGEFRRVHPKATEQPWFDLGLLKSLNRAGYPHACQLLGIFCDKENTYVVTSLATEGDLFSWCFREPGPSREREAAMLPLAKQIISAVTLLHDLGVAHRDLSLENILLTDAGDGELRIQIIDFAMATLSRKCFGELRGKASYSAPEMHGERQYDTFLADVFSLGVVLFAMACQDYPWTATKMGACPRFEYYCKAGILKLLERRKVRGGSGERLTEVLSHEIAELLGGLLELEPRRRVGLGESCFKGSRHRPSVWEFAWLRGEDSEPAGLWCSAGEGATVVEACEEC
mmetsp:Transcript_127426/g.271675  ORF Transcript_127426/g.271675 Transcript_127426/m.271675 type:complete len:466 (-) Transcript_127426:136-1533(-)